MSLALQRSWSLDKLNWVDKCVKSMRHGLLNSGLGVFSGFVSSILKVDHKRTCAEHAAAASCEYFPSSYGQIV